jgi:hypothetical protein
MRIVHTRTKQGEAYWRRIDKRVRAAIAPST